MGQVWRCAESAPGIIAIVFQTFTEGGCPQRNNTQGHRLGLAFHGEHPPDNRDSIHLQQGYGFPVQLVTDFLESSDPRPLS